MIQDQRGSLTLQTCIAVIPVLLFFVTLLQFSDLYAHQLMVTRAASAAVRAATVVLPDDGARYGDPDNRERDRPVGQRLSTVREAALGMLRASPSFDLQTTTLALTGTFRASSAIHAQLATDYHCLVGHLPLVCGRTGTLRLQAAASLNYQAAPYAYAR